MNSIYDELAMAVANMDEEEAVRIAKEIIDNGYSPAAAIEQGLICGMNMVSARYESEEYFITEVLLCADAMDAAFEVLAKYIKPDEIKERGRVVIGTIYGDTHDIGKNIVALMLKGAGFAVMDLGKDVSAKSFIEGAEDFAADIIAVSTLMTTTMGNIKDVIDLLIEKGLRNKYSVIIGGKPCSTAFAEKIGADGYSGNAAGAVRLCEYIMRSARISN